MHLLSFKKVDLKKIFFQTFRCYSSKCNSNEIISKKEKMTEQDKQQLDAKH